MTTNHVAQLAGVGVETVRFCHQAGEIIGSERPRRLSRTKRDPSDVLAEFPQPFRRAIIGNPN